MNRKPIPEKLVRELRTSGMSGAEIAGKLGYAESTMYHFLNKLGLNVQKVPTPKVYNDIDNPRVLARWQGMAKFE